LPSDEIGNLKIDVAKRNIKSGFVARDTLRISEKLRTAREVGQLLEELRNDYQALAPEEQRGVKTFMSDLFELLDQRRQGEPSRF
jgi:hypothetical protein